MNIDVAFVIFQPGAPRTLSVCFDDDRGERSAVMGADRQVSRLGGIQEGESVAEGRVDACIAATLRGQVGDHREFPFGRFRRSLSDGIDELSAGLSRISRSGSCQTAGRGSSGSAAVVTAAADLAVTSSHRPAASRAGSTIQLPLTAGTAGMAR